MLALLLSCEKRKRQTASPFRDHPDHSYHQHNSNINSFYYFIYPASWYWTSNVFLLTKVLVRYVIIRADKNATGTVTSTRN